MPSRAARLLVLLTALLCAAGARAATVTVTAAVPDTGSNAVDGAVTLREAIASINLGANLNADVVAAGTYGTGDTIAFSVPGAGPHTVTLGATPLPVIVKPVLIDGYTEPGSSPNTLAVGDDAVLQIVLLGTDPSVHGFEIQPGGGGTTIRGFSLQNHFFAVQIATSNVTVAGNFIGTDRTGTTASAATSNNVGVNVSIGNIGGNLVGGSTPADRNVISGNGAGLIFNSQLGNTVRGNYIGVNAAGTADLGNVGQGIYIGSVGTPTIGGAVIGGVTATPGQGPGNVISGNDFRGIDVSTSGTGIDIGAVDIQGNIIGLDATGTTAIPNTGPNIYLFDANLPNAPNVQSLGPVTIGGSAAGAGNVIGGNGTGHGIFHQARGTVIQGNRIGTDISGTLSRGQLFGIELSCSSIAFCGSATIGGSGPNEGNVISGNASDAIRVFLSTATIEGNRIGVSASGTALPNGGPGVFVDSGDATIGGTSAGQGNVIGNNGSFGDPGVRVRIGFANVRNASQATILGNSIFGSSGLAINNDVPDLVTPNDSGDGDSGPNELQNFPVITSATLAGGNVTVSGTLNTTDGQGFRVELFSNASCDPLFNGEAKTFLGFVDVNTDGSGNGSFGPVSFAIPAGEPVITATATNKAGDTSELSACLTATGGQPLPTLSIGNASSNEGNAGTTPFGLLVTLSAASATPVTVAYTTVDNSAGAPGDYATTAGVLTFAVGGPLSQTITVPVAGETAVEPNESFFVDLSSPSGATLATSRGTGTIVNDDVAGPEPEPSEIPTLSGWALMLLAAGLAALGLRRLPPR